MLGCKALISGFGFIYDLGFKVVLGFRVACTLHLRLSRV